MDLCQELEIDSVGICLKKVWPGGDREATTMAGKSKKSVTSGGLENVGLCPSNM